MNDATDRVLANRDCKQAANSVLLRLYDDNMQKAIVAIGGGHIRLRETVPIDREIIRLSGRRNPKILLIPTASSDDQSYWVIFQKYFGDFLQCRTEVLFLVREHPAKEQIRKKIAWADIVYVGGGNTLKMMRLWRRLGVDRLLVAAYEKGTVLCGVSAGSICWFESGHSDSMSYYNPQKWEYINVKGLGLIRGIHCPHYNGMTQGVRRRKHFQKMIRKTGGMGIAIDNNCAIEFIDGRSYKVITSKSRARAFRVYKREGEVMEERIPQDTKRAPIEALYRRGD